MIQEDLAQPTEKTHDVPAHGCGVAYESFLLSDRPGIAREIRPPRPMRKRNVRMVVTSRTRSLNI